ncbi:MAG: hypothetical protein HKN91_05770 [Acidimicrobiia bacterium]|nr:hypothetical protein [Acidimicrobiia bacterium]
MRFVDSGVRLKRDYRAVLWHNNGITWMVSPIFVVGAGMHFLGGRGFDLYYVGMLGIGVLFLLAVVTGRTVLTETELVSGSVFWRRRISRSEIAEVIKVKSLSSAFHKPFIDVVTTDGVRRTIPLSQDLFSDTTDRWIAEIRAWMPDRSPGTVPGIVDGGEAVGRDRFLAMAAAAQGGWSLLLISGVALSKGATAVAITLAVVGVASMAIGLWLRRSIASRPWSKPS